MPRPKIRRCIKFNPTVSYFKPRGIPLRQLKEVDLLADELEAVKLYFIDELEQIKAAEKMGVSQPTFARILGSALKKITEAIVEGKAVKINKSDED